MSIQQSIVRREGLCISGKSAEPSISVGSLIEAIKPEEVESFRPLLPVGYETVADAYRRATIGLTAKELSSHYSDGIQEFHSTFVPYLKQQLSTLSGGEWCFDDYVAYAAGSDVDMMGHIVEAESVRSGVALYPGDWYGFLVGSSHQDKIHWTENSEDKLACLCVPSVRNGHLTTEMIAYLDKADACLLNINLYPTLSLQERIDTARALTPVLGKSIISVSFSRGFGMTASQLGVILIHKDHPYRKKYDESWSWYSYFHNQIAVRTFMCLDVDKLAEVDERRRIEVDGWLETHNFPKVKTGTYYVKSFSLQEDVPSYLKPLVRENLVRLCFKPRSV